MIGIYGGAAVLIAYFVWRGVRGSRQLVKEESARMRQWRSDVYARQQAEASAFSAIRGCVRERQRPGPNGRWLDRNDLLAHGRADGEGRHN